MQNIDLTNSATTQIGWLRNGEITAVQLLQSYIDHYERTNPALNAIVSTDIKGAMAQAKEIDERRAKGEDIGALQGLPMTIKDSIDVDGLPAVCGDPKMVNRPKQTEDAYVVRCVKDADGIIWGKTNAPYMAGDIQTYNDVYGVTNNPHDVSRTPGGSSGGAAAALSSHMTPLEIGSDIGGSLRTPAHYCGIYTLKPTWGTIPLKGHVPPPPGVNVPDADLAVVGPMGRTITDIDMLFQLLAPDVATPKSVKQVKELKVAIYEDEFFTIGKEVKAAIDTFAEKLKGQGAEVTVDRPDIDGKTLMDVYVKILTPILTVDLPKKTRRMMKWMRPLSNLLAKKGEMSLHNTIKYAYHHQSSAQKAAARKERQELKDKCDIFFQEYDLLIAPVTAVPAIPHNNKGQLYGRKIAVDGQNISYMNLFQWIALATTCHLPSLVIPFGTSKDDLPIGIQIIAKEGEDRKLIEISKSLGL